MRRLIGLLLIIRGFSPILFVLVVVWALGQMLADFNAAIEAPIKNIQAEIALLETDIEAVHTNFEALETSLSDAQRILDNSNMTNLLTELPALDFPDELSLPNISLGNFGIPIPNRVTVTWETARVEVVEEFLEEINCGPFQFACDGFRTVFRTVTRTAQYPDISVSTTNFNVNIPSLTDLPSIPFPSIFGDIADEITGVFDVFTDIFSSFDLLFDSVASLGTTLEEVPESLNGIIEESENLFNLLKSFFLQWSFTIGTALIVVAILFVVYYVGAFFGDVGRGWTLLIHGSSTDRV